FQTFERVVVQNILHGLSPSLSDAIASVSRWRLFRAALPHIIQCCGSLLEASDSRGLSISLQKILYILHWMLLDSASECAEVSPKDEPSQQTRGQGLFAISSIQLFVYLIAPLADTVSEEDISSNIRLESGLKIWQALWQVGTMSALFFIWIFIVQPDQNRPQVFTAIDSSSPCGLEEYLPPCDFDTRMVVDPGIVLLLAGFPDGNARLLLSLRDCQVMNPRCMLQRDTQEHFPATTRRKPLGAVTSTPFCERQPSTLAVDVQEKPMTTSTPGIVRSVSEYKTCEPMIPVSRLSKSNTANAFDSSPTSDSSLRVLEEVNSALKFAEDSNSLSGVFCSHDAPIVHISDVCSGFSQEMNDSLASSVV
ncbi:hypothetical protein Angca_006380, partial [Angiostrongylus cantonensis]